MTTYPVPLCPFCRHFRKNSPTLTCDAFPNGIPESIYASAIDHRLPVYGDNNRQFEAEDKEAAQYAEQLFGKLS